MEQLKSQENLSVKLEIGECYVIESKDTPFHKRHGVEIELKRFLYEDHAEVIPLDKGLNFIINVKYIKKR